MTLVACPSVLRASSGSVAVVLSVRVTKNTLGTSFVVGSDGFSFWGLFAPCFHQGVPPLRSNIPFSSLVIVSVLVQVLIRSLLC